MSANLKITALGAGLAWLVVACGGGPLAGISGTGITSQGTATGFGSVFVNGVEFDTDNAQIVVNDQPATEADLRVGQVLTVTGTLRDETHGTADTVIFDRLLDGPVEAVDAQNGIVTALDQRIRIDDSTRFIGVTPDDLAVLNLVAVSGFANDSGEILATSLQRGAVSFVYGTTTDVEGMVSGLNNIRFSIGDLRVDYSNASVDENGGTLRNGAAVEVFGIQTRAGGIFFADSVRVLDRTLGDPGERVELEGVVTNFNGRGDFTISGQPVDASSAVQEDDTGMTLRAGVRVEVEGTIDNNGVLIAESFSIRAPSDLSLSGSVDSVRVAKSTLQIFGVPVKVDEATQYQDNSAANERTLRLGDLRFADGVEVRAFRDADGGLAAVGIVRTDFDALAAVRAPVATQDCDARAHALMMAEVTVRMDAALLTARNGTSTDVAGFCSSLADGPVVEAEGTQNGTELLATTIGFAQ